MSTSSCHPPGAERPKLEVADIFRTHGGAYRATHALTPEQARTMRAIERCRTAALGGHLDVCDRCDFERPAYNSCRDRHCPKCQSLAQAAWIEARKERILPTHYFHLVFTLPEELRPLALHNRRRVFDLLFEAASRTLLELGRDQDRLGAVLGFTAVLHTWTRDLNFHPHLHIIVTGGGLAIDGTKWVSVRSGRFLFPVTVLSQLFRGKFLDALVKARKRGELAFSGSCAALWADDVFAALKDKLYRKEWVVFAKRPFGGAEQVYRYLSLYTHRVGISNYRLQAMDEAGVRFATKEGRSVTVSGVTFIRRFLLHVLPAGFVKIRHYGLLAAANVSTKLEFARHLLGLPPSAAHPSTPATPWSEQIFLLTGVDWLRCPRCVTGTMVRHALPTAPTARSPPSPASVPEP